MESAVALPLAAFPQIALEHLIPRRGDKARIILPIKGIDPHARQQVTARSQKRVDIADVIRKARLRLVQGSHLAERYLKIVVGAVKGEHVACLLAYRLMAYAENIMLGFGKAKAPRRVLQRGGADALIGFLSP